jgi:hypothetical protein
MKVKITCSVGPPLMAGGKTVYLIGRAELHLGSGHGFAKNSPLGILVLEPGDVFFTSFDPDFAPADILPLLEQIRLQGISLRPGSGTAPSG